jgi:DNA/RNA endonuclease G (NUC1)
LLLSLPLPARQPKEPNPNVRFGLPATADPKDRDAYLIERPRYVLGYNATTRTPNWVCCRLTASDIGKARRVQEVRQRLFLDIPSGAGQFSQVP